MFGFELDTVVQHLLQIGVAYLLALPLAWNREHSAQSAGLRTFPLVSVAACGYMLTGIQVLGTTDAESRVIYGIVTGMGFIGGGAILKTRDGVAGTATAASLWNTGAIGVAVAWHRYEIASVLAVINFLTLQCVTWLKEQPPRD
ncbi:MAG: MgtC/SapB family protein [Gammaproteobacteria bacterium]